MGKDTPALSAAQQGKRRCLKIACVAAFVFGVVTPFLPELVALLIFVIPTNLAFAWWVRFDFVEQNYPTSRLLYITILVLPFIFLWYLFRTRGRWAFISLMKMLAFYVLLMVIVFGSAFLVVGIWFCFFQSTQPHELLR